MTAEATIPGQDQDSAAAAEPSRPTSPPPAPSTFTAFFIKYCYLIIGGLLGLNAAIAFFVFLFAGQNAWIYLLTAGVLSFGLLTGLWSFLEDKQKVPLPKRVVTLIISCALPFLQTGVTLIPKPLERLTTAEVTDLNTAIAVVKANEYRDPDAIAREGLPILEKLGRKYPQNDEVLFLLGIARFETRRFKEAADAFAVLVDHAPRNFKNQYHLGIAYKRTAEVQEEALTEGKPVAASATAIAALRRKAKDHLEAALALYQTSYDTEGYYWWRLQRNIGWLEYLLSSGCADQAACVRALDRHDRALKGDAHFPGNPKYILAYRNIGRIHHRMGNDAYAERVLREGIELHQAMVNACESDAWKLENRYIYTELARQLFDRQQTREAFAVFAQATRTFSPDVYQNDGLEPRLRALLQLAASQARARARQGDCPPVAWNIERD